MKSKVYREARRYYPKYLMNDTHTHTQMQKFTILIKEKKSPRYKCFKYRWRDGVKRISENPEFSANGFNIFSVIQCHFRNFKPDQWMGSFMKVHLWFSRRKRRRK